MKSPTDPLQLLSDAMWDFVDPFISSIGLVLPGDDRQPPGEHHGTGAFVMIGGIPQLLTCEHVARHQVSGTLVYSRLGCDFGTAVGNNFKLHPYPQDVAFASLSRSWRIVKHQGRCIPMELFASAHQPISEEFLYVHGFPGQDAAANYGQHDVKAVGALTFEVGLIRC